MHEAARRARELYPGHGIDPCRESLSKAPVLGGSARRSADDVHAPTTRFPVSADIWQSVAGALGLSPRELDVVQGIFDGGTETSIARLLNISVHTIHSHLDRLYKKLKVPNRTGLTLRVFEEILVSERASGGLIRFGA